MGISSYGYGNNWQYCLGRLGVLDPAHNKGTNDQGDARHDHHVGLDRTHEGKDDTTKGGSNNLGTQIVPLKRPR